MLRRALRGGNVMRVRKIVGGKLVCDPKWHAIRSVLFNSNIRIASMGDLDQRDVFVLPHPDNMSIRL